MDDWCVTCPMPCYNVYQNIHTKECVEIPSCQDGEYRNNPDYKYVRSINCFTRDNYSN